MLVSVILPAYNADKYIAEAIESVINQSWKCWELLVINDGSSDDTEKIVKSYVDPRIRYFKQFNQGVSAARNLGLKNVKGDLFCFLDADDLLPGNSLKSRVEIFDKSPEVRFVDGSVEEKTEDLTETIKESIPTFQGNPLKELIRIRSSCFVGQTWMIRRDKQLSYSMPVDQTHGEDLFFFANLSRRGGVYHYTNETILIYRRRQGSAMSNLKGLDNSYIQIFRKIRKWPELSNSDKLYFWLKSRKIMFLSYFFDGKDPKNAFFSLFKV